MDKNYNVDDILSEIKRKKSAGRGHTGDSSARPRPEEQAGHPEGRAAKRPKDDFVVRIPEEDFGESGASAGEPVPERDFRVFTPGNKGGAGREPRIKPPAAEEQAEAKNPLDFSGHVRPITDKARIRGRRPPGATGRQAAVPGEFSFNSEAAVPPGQSNTRPGFGNTRVLPKFSTGKELRLEDIQGLDYGAESGYDPDLYEDEDFGDSIPDGTKVDFSEYNSVENRDDVATDIAHTKLWLFVRAAANLLLASIAVYFAYSGKYWQLPMFPAIWAEGDTLRMYMMACTVVTSLMALVNSSAIGGGLISFFKFRANADSLAAFAVLAAVAQGVTGIANPDASATGAMTYYFPLACLALLFNSLGKMSMINRIQQNFRVLGSDREKRAVLPVESASFRQEFVDDVTLRRPTVAYSVKSGFFTEFLALSYSDKYDVGINRSVAPVCVAGAVVVGLATYFLSGGVTGALSAATAVLCVCATLSATFIENIPLGKMAKKIAPSGGMVSGSKAVEDFCDTKAVVLTESDLFGAVSLRGIKAFSQGRIDEAILDAASVLCALDGALAPLFLQMINGNKKLLKKVDTIVFENGMGISAWIDSRRVLIGNRRLMQNHGIPLPTDSYERGEAGDIAGDPIYLSNSGEVFARFLVEYHANQELAGELDYLSARGIRLVVATNDANIDARKVWEAYGYPEDLTSILSSDQLSEYREMATPRREAIAEIVYTGKAPAMIRSISACIAARSSILSATVIELAQMILGYGLVAFFAFMGALPALSVTRLLIYQAFWFFGIFIVQHTRHS